MDSEELLTFSGDSPAKRKKSSSKDKMENENIGGAIYASAFGRPMTFWGAAWIAAVFLIKAMLIVTFVLVIFIFIWGRDAHNTVDDIKNTTLWIHELVEPLPERIEWIHQLTEPMRDELCDGKQPQCTVGLMHHLGHCITPIPFRKNRTPCRSPCFRSRGHGLEYNVTIEDEPETEENRRRKPHECWEGECVGDRCLGDCRSSRDCPNLRFESGFVEKQCVMSSHPPGFGMCVYFARIGNPSEPESCVSETAKRQCLSLISNRERRKDCLFVDAFCPETGPIRNLRCQFGFLCSDPIFLSH